MLCNNAKQMLYNLVGILTYTYTPYYYSWRSRLGTNGNIHSKMA